MSDEGLLHYEDVVVGRSERFGAYTITREEIIAFARQYDPQPFHLDDAAAAAGPFGSLAASGWNTAGIVMRLMVDHVIGKQAGRGGAGVRELRWTQPVRPGDVLTLELTCIAKRRSTSRPDLGLVDMSQRLLNQREEEVLTMITIGMIAVRDPAAPDQPQASSPEAV